MTRDEMRRRVVSHWITSRAVVATHDEQQYLTDLLERDLFPDPAPVSVPVSEIVFGPVKAPYSPSPLPDIVLPDLSADVDFGMSPLASPLSPAETGSAEEPERPGETPATDPLARSVVTPEEVYSSPPPAEPEAEDTEEGDEETLDAYHAAIDRMLEPTLMEPTEPEPTPEPTEAHFETALKIAQSLEDDLLFRQGIQFTRVFDRFVERIVEEVGLTPTEARRMANKALSRLRQDDRIASMRMSLNESIQRQAKLKDDPTAKNGDQGERQCTVCGTMFRRRGDEPKYNFSVRKTCSDECKRAALKRSLENRPLPRR